MDNLTPESDREDSTDITDTAGTTNSADTVTADTMTNETADSALSSSEQEGDLHPSDGASEESKKSKNPVPRYTKVLRYIVAPILAAAAVICAVFAVMFATIWKPDPRATALATSSARYIVTDPGVLPLGNNQVDISVKSSSRVCLAVGSTSDVNGWIASHPYTRVSGLNTWQELKTSAQTAPAAASSPSSSPSNLALKDSDMWLTSKCGSGTVNVKWNASSATQALIVDTNPAAKATSDVGHHASLSLSWVRTKVLDLTVPLSFLAVLLLLCAVLCATVFAVAPQRRRKREQERAERAAAQAEESSEHLEESTDTPRWVEEHVAASRRGTHAAHTSHRKQKRGWHPFAHKTSKVDDADAAQGGNDGASPQIVDVQDVNMVAKAQQAEPATPSKSAMEDYFARLAQERLGDENHDAYEEESPVKDASKSETSDEETNENHE